MKEKSFSVKAPKPTVPGHSVCVRAMRGMGIGIAALGVLRFLREWLALPELTDEERENDIW